MDKAELLKVLDMSETEQRIEIAKYLPEQKTHRLRGFVGATICDKCGDEAWNETLECEYITPYEKSLADLAFRLRDEAVKANHRAFHDGIYEVMLHVVGNDNIATAFWGEEYAQPIHWIIAALRAKGIDNGKN